MAVPLSRLTVAFETKGSASSVEVTRLTQAWQVIFTLSVTAAGAIVLYGPACFAVSGLRFPVRAPHAMLARRAAAQKKQQRRKSYLQCMRRREKQGAAKGTMGALLMLFESTPTYEGRRIRQATCNPAVC